MVKKLVVTLTTRPQPCSSIRGTAARVIRNAHAVDLEETAPVVGLDLGEANRMPEVVLLDHAHADRGVVDQNVEAATVGADVATATSQLGTRDIGLNLEDIEGARLERCRVQIEDRHPGAAGQQALGDRRRRCRGRR